MRTHPGNVGGHLLRCKTPLLLSFMTPRLGVEGMERRRRPGGEEGEAIRGIPAHAAVYVKIPQLRRLAGTPVLLQEELFLVLPLRCSHLTRPTGSARVNVWMNTPKRRKTTHNKLSVPGCAPEKRLQIQADPIKSSQVSAARRLSLRLSDSVFRKFLSLLVKQLSRKWKLFGANLPKQHPDD